MAAKAADIGTADQILEQTKDLVPASVTTAIDTTGVALLRDELANMAAIASRGLFPEIADPLKGTDEELADRLAKCEPLIASLKTRLDGAEVSRKAETDPLHTAKERIMARWRTLTHFHAQALERVTGTWQSLKGELGRRDSEKQRLADDKARKQREDLIEQATAAEDKGRIGRAETLRDRAAMVAAPAVERVSCQKSAVLDTMKVWTYEVLDPTKIPALYLIVDDAAVGGIVKTLGERAVAALGGADAIRVFQKEVPKKKRGT